MMGCTDKHDGSKYHAWKQPCMDNSWRSGGYCLGHLDRFSDLGFVVVGAVDDFPVRSLVHLGEVKDTGPFDCQPSPRSIFKQDLAVSAFGNIDDLKHSAGQNLVPGLRGEVFARAPVMGDLVAHQFLFSLG